MATRGPPTGTPPAPPGAGRPLRQHVCSLKAKRRRSPAFAVEACLSRAAPNPGHGMFSRVLLVGQGVPGLCDGQRDRVVGPERGSGPPQGRPGRRSGLIGLAQLGKGGGEAGRGEQCHEVVGAECAPCPPQCVLAQHAGRSASPAAARVKTGGCSPLSPRRDCCGCGEWEHRSGPTHPTTGARNLPAGQVDNHPERSVTCPHFRYSGTPGRDMAAAHQRPNITDAAFGRVVGAAVAVLSPFAVRHCEPVRDPGADIDTAR